MQHSSCPALSSVIPAVLVHLIFQARYLQQRVVDLVDPVAAFARSSQNHGVLGHAPDIMTWGDLVHGRP